MVGLQLLGQADSQSTIDSHHEICGDPRTLSPDNDDVACAPLIEVDDVGCRNRTLVYNKYLWQELLHPLVIASESHQGDSSTPGAQIGPTSSLKELFPALVTGLEHQP